MIDIETRRPMNEDVKRAWVKALRSGEYRKGKRRLRSADGHYCVMGVLCELAVKEGVIAAPVLEGSRYVYCDFSSASLPYAVAEWAGLIDHGDEDGDYSAYGNAVIETPRADYLSVLEMNDGDDKDYLLSPDNVVEGLFAGLSFDQIADLLEAFEVYAGE